MDKLENPQVRDAFFQVEKIARQNGLRFEPLEWDARFKGIDDPGDMDPGLGLCPQGKALGGIAGEPAVLQEWDARFKGIDDFLYARHLYFTG